VASLSQGRTAAAQCGLFTHKSVPVIFEPPCITICNVANFFLSITCYYHPTYAEYSCNRHRVCYVYGLKRVCHFCNVLLIFVPSMLKCGNFSVALRSTSTV